MPSIYLGCAIDDEIAEGLGEVRKSFAEVQKDIEDELGSLQPLLDALEGPEKKATLIVGTALLDNQIRWTAVNVGPNGDQIGIFYEYLGPDISSGTPADRPPSSYVDDTGIIHMVLAVKADATIDTAYNVSTVLPIWLSDPDVAALVTGEVLNTGLGYPDPTGVNYLSGGQGKPLTDSENEADNMAKVFGQTTYEKLLEVYDIPVITDTTAQAILNDSSIDSVVINGKLLIIEGTNLNGINALYEVVGSDLAKLKELLALMEATDLVPYWAVTENVSTISYELVCDVLQPLSTITETYRAFDKNIDVIANQYSNGNYGVFNNYIFWSIGVTPSMAAANKLQYLGMPSDYYEYIFNGEDAEQSDETAIVAPLVYTVEDPTLLSKLDMTDAELEELLSKKVSGIKIPSTVTPAEIGSILNNSLVKTDNELLSNGLSSKVKNAMVAGQAVDLSKSMNDENLSKELAERGKACARQDKNWPPLPPTVPTPDFPNVPSIDLPDTAKKVESAYAAISSAINTGTRTFDNAFDSIKKVITPVLNKLQNLSSVAKNLQDNKLIECALGSSELATGFIDTDAIGPGTGIGSGGLGDGATPSIGGIPVPMDLFQESMTALSTQLNEAINSSFEKLMKLLRKPICMLQQLLVTVSGTDLGGEVDPCKEAKDTDENCPVLETQEVVNESESISDTLSKLPQTKDLPTEEVRTEVVDVVQKFTGVLSKTPLNVAQDVSRGIKQVMEDLNDSLESKLSFLDKFDKAIQDVVGNTQDVKLNGDPNYGSKQDCTPASVGSLTDAIVNYL
jgi:hypothetical protein